MPLRRYGLTLSISLFVAACRLTAQSHLTPGTTGNPMDQLPNSITQTLKTQIVWDRGLEHPPGSHLRFMKIDETDLSQRHFFRYRIFAEGAKEDMKYALDLWKIGSSPTDLKLVTDEAYVNRRGLLLVRKPRPEQEDSETADDGTELDVAVRVAKGEPARFVLHTKDEKVLISGTVVPAPIESVDGNCKLTAMLAVPEGEAILISADGFPPNEQITVHSDSAGEKMDKVKMADSNGHSEYVELPSVVGKDAGSVRETLTAKSCSVSVEIPWGKGTYHPL
jgi:hypothetical protein